MDNATPDPPSSSTVRPSTPTSSASSTDNEGFSHLPESPTKRKSPPSQRLSRSKTGHSRDSGDTTPRPPKVLKVLAEQTPRAKPPKMLLFTEAEDEDQVIDMQGYTLSHLRRVPELALLAKRVVQAEAKRRSREERKKEKEKAQSHKPGPISSSRAAASTNARMGSDSERLGPKIKRLFRFAIRELYQDGSIILWDGPTRKLPSSSPSPSLGTFFREYQSQLVSAHRLWKSNTSTSTAGGNSTVLSSLSEYSATIAEEDDDDDGELSDPPPTEESYIPLTTPYLSRALERYITDFTSSKSSSSTTSRPTSLVLAKPKKGPRPGPTPAELLAFMQRRDETWARVGEWVVKEALEFGKAEGRVWCIGDNRWEVCG